MKRILITMVILLLVPIFNSCDKNKSYPKDSILGTWRCLEQSSVQGYRQYNVSIDFQGNDSTLITVFNFYNLGYQIETYGSIQDTVITLIGTNSFDDFSGTGHIERDFSAIYWQFTYFGQTTDPQVEATYFRP